MREPRAAPTMTDEESAQLARILDRLARRSPLWRSAASLSRDAPADGRDVAPLLERVRNPSCNRWLDRIAACEMLGNMALRPADQVSAARACADVLTGKVGCDRKGRVHLAARRIWRTTLMPAAVVDVLLDYFRRGPGSHPTSGLCILGLIFGLIFVAPISAVIEDRRLNQVRAAAAKALGNLGAVESVDEIGRSAVTASLDALAAAAEDRGPLLSALGESTARSAVLSALQSVLPAISANHYGQLDAQTVPRLCRLLDGSTNEALAMAILHALEVAGDGRAVDTVARAASGRRSEQIRAEAERILPILEERGRREMDSERLLRPSESPDSEILLRPAQSSQETPAELLLRPTNSPH